MRIAFLLFAGWLTVEELKAHDVVWWEDPDGSAPGNAMDFYYPSEFRDFIGVVPSTDEPCTVVVNLNPPTSTLVSAIVLPPNPANEVDILVTILRQPIGLSETATISGEWHATGQPTNSGCTAITPNLFTVPILVISTNLFWHVGLAGNGRSVMIDAGINCALQAAESLTGPWINIGKGQTFAVDIDAPAMFFQRLTRLGGLLSGTVTDPSGSPLPGTTLGLPYGGPTATTDPTGAFSFPRLPWGTNLITVTNPIGVSLNLEIPTTTNTVTALTVGMGAGPATNACNCTPWCAVGFGSLPGGQTPVYYAGGANPSQNASQNCGPIQVTVTTPNGTTYPITPGSSRHQNSGPNPASGTWTVTTTVCGQTKSCTVTVP